MASLIPALVTAVVMATLPAEAFAVSDTTKPLPPTFQRAPCDFQGVDADWAGQNDVECGWLLVPESRGLAGSRQLKLWIAIARADASTKRADPILYLHGGPGLATVDYFFPFFPQSKTWPGFRKTRHIVYFDQRGTGRSEPAFCPELGTALEVIDQQSPPPGEALQRKRAAYSACRGKMLESGFDFGAYNSTATVEDAEDLRRALGIAQWNLYGISYGTLVGFEYLRQHPDSIRSAILDSVFPPNSPHGAEQISSTARAYQALQRDCDTDADCHARFPDILSQLGDAVRKLDAAPLQCDGGRITGDSLASALWQMLVSSESATWVPLAVSRAAAGDAAAIRGIVSAFGSSGGFGGLSHGQAMTANCYEVTTGATAATVGEMMRRYPQLAGAQALAGETDALCAAWQPERAPMSHFAPVHSTVSVLLYGGEFDPATPFDDALLASRTLPNSTLVHVRGASHAAFYQDDCTRGIAHAFLADPQVAPDLACLARRPAPDFPTQGLDGFLQSMQK